MNNDELHHKRIRRALEDAANEFHDLPVSRWAGLVIYLMQCLNDGLPADDYWPVVEDVSADAAASAARRMW
jgi:hypothetical protein